MTYETAKQKVDELVKQFEESAPDQTYKSAFALGGLSSLAAQWLAELETYRNRAYSFQTTKRKDQYANS